MTRVELRRADWEFRTPFRIAYRTRTHAETVVVQLQQGEWIGRGEASGVSYHGESAATLLEQLRAFTSELHRGVTVTRETLQQMMPAGGARNAIDCALWDLEAKRARCRAWELAGLASVRPLMTAYTLGIDAPQAMGRAALAAREYTLLKIKLAGADDLERVAAIRQARPDAELIVDANQSWQLPQLETLTPRFAELGVSLIEQPLPVGEDAVLADFNSPVPLCADESCQTRQSLPSLLGKYQYLNIKLDKTGGLTEALALASAAKAAGMKLMVGCMGGSSLSMAPAFILGQWCDVVDLDSPLLIKSDLPFAIRYEGSRMSPPDAQLWG